jgi:hypothetical protein
LEERVGYGSISDPHRRFLLGGAGVSANP